jgi:ABC-2 type transport system permease protein
MTPDPYPHQHRGRLSTLAAAWVVARRDFAAILFSRSFFFFLLGPLFPLIVGGLAGSVGQHVDQSDDTPVLGVVMAPADAQAMAQARNALARRLGGGVPEFRVIAAPPSGPLPEPAAVLAREKVAAVLSGTPAVPVLTGPRGQVQAWSGGIAMVAAQAKAGSLGPWPAVRLQATATSRAGDSHARLRTAQGAQTLLFLLTMMLAGMVLSNLVEEKANKIIEVLAAAIPMEAVFFGKLFAMLGVSLVGIAAWGAVGGGLALLAGSALPTLPTPAVGWPLLVGLGVVYFSMAYLLLGSVFLAVGSLAATVREVQTISMPVTMLQLLLFFLASYAMTQPGSAIELFAVLFPFSSPYAMLARAAQDGALLPHAAALVWQAAWVFALVRLGSMLFRRRVMQSGAQRARRGKRRGSARKVALAGD